MDIQKITMKVAAIMEENPDLNDLRDSSPAIPLEGGLLMCLSEKTPIHLVEKMRDCMEKENLSLTSLVGLDKSESNPEGLRKAISTAHTLDCTYGHAHAEGLGLVILLSEEPTEYQMDAYEESCESMTNEKGLARIILLGPRKHTVYEVLQKPQKPQKNEPSPDTGVETIPTEGRPDRKTVITQDEVVDMRIALEQALDVNEFLKTIEGG